MPAEILHQMFLGVVEYALGGFVNLYYEKGLSRFNQYGRNIYSLSNHNSDRSIPDLSYQYVFTSLTRQKGSDRVGLCLMILLCLSSEVADLIGELYKNPLLLEYKTCIDLYFRTCCYTWNGCHNLLICYITCKNMLSRSNHLWLK